MAANPTKPRTETFSGPREHQSYRLEPRIIALIEDIAQGIQEGDAGLKSCALAGLSAASDGAKPSAVVAAHDRAVAEIEDEDECFNAIGDLLAKGFSHAEIRRRVRLAGGSTHLLALERWCDREKVMCDPDVEPVVWVGSLLHERRARARRAMSHLRQTTEGTAHAAVLHVVYGHPDPMLYAARRFMGECRRIANLRRSQETTEEVPTLHPADRETFSLAKTLLETLGTELAPLARYTARVEAKREEMVREAVRAVERAADCVDLTAARRRQERASLVLSSVDALRRGMAAFCEPPALRGEGEGLAAFEARTEARRARKAAHGAARAAFILDVKLDANRMLTEASVAFRDAWKAS